MQKMHFQRHARSQFLVCFQHVLNDVTKLLMPEFSQEVVHY